MINNCHNKIPQQPNHFPRGKIFENALFKTYISLKMYFLIAFFNKQKKYSKLQPVTIKFPNNTIIFQGQDIWKCFMPTTSFVQKSFSKNHFPRGKIFENALFQQYLLPKKFLTSSRSPWIPQKLRTQLISFQEFHKPAKHPCWLKPLCNIVFFCFPIIIVMLFRFLGVVSKAKGWAASDNRSLETWPNLWGEEKTSLIISWIRNNIYDTF